MAATDPATKATGHIEAVIEVTCCGKGGAKLNANISVDVPAASGGRELGKAVCDLCGSEYTLGVLARTREESLASEAFEHLTDEQEEKIGIDRDDFDPSIEDAAMCGGCDGDVNRLADRCGGCKEYVCQRCRKRSPRHPMRHAMEEHWEEPKVEMGAAVDVDDDGGTFDRDDFVSEA